MSITLTGGHGIKVISAFMSWLKPFVHARSPLKKKSTGYQSQPACHILHWRRDLSILCSSTFGCIAETISILYHSARYHHPNFMAPYISVFQLGFDVAFLVYFSVA